MAPLTYDVPVQGDVRAKLVDKSVRCNYGRLVPSLMLWELPTALCISFPAAKARLGALKGGRSPQVLKAKGVRSHSKNPESNCCFNIFNIIRKSLDASHPQPSSRIYGHHHRVHLTRHTQPANLLVSASASLRSRRATSRGGSKSLRFVTRES